MGQVNLRTIANACGISHTLVSRALRGQSGVSPAKRKQILQMAEEMGYRPDPLVSILLSQVRRNDAPKRHATLAWVNTSPVEERWHRNLWDRDYLTGARKRADQLGYSLDEFWIHPQGLSVESFERILKARNIYGIIYPCAEEHAALNGFHWENYAAVLVNWSWPDCALSRASGDGYGNLKLALQKLTEGGARRIGLFCQSGFDSTNNDDHLNARFSLFSQQFRSSDRIPVLNARNAFPKAEAEIAAWLDRYEPDVVVCQDNHVLTAIEKTGRKVPRDLGLVHLNLAADVEGWAGIDARISAIISSAVDLVIGSLSRNERGVPPFTKVVTVGGYWKDGWTWLPK